MDNDISSDGVLHHNTYWRATASVSRGDFFGLTRTSCVQSDNESESGTGSVRVVVTIGHSVALQQHLALQISNSADASTWLTVARDCSNFAQNTSSPQSLSSSSSLSSSLCISHTNWRHHNTTLNYVTQVQYTIMGSNTHTLQSVRFVAKSDDFTGENFIVYHIGVDL